MKCNLIWSTPWVAFIIFNILRTEIAKLILLKTITFSVWIENNHIFRFCHLCNNIMYLHTSFLSFNNRNPILINFAAIIHELWKQRKPSINNCNLCLPYVAGCTYRHLAGVYIPADIYVRFLRMKGEDVLFIGGSDEHGVPSYKSPSRHFPIRCCW